MKPVLTLFTACLLTPCAAYPADRPNVLLILADDLGVRDLGCFGSRYHETPNIDRLASRGLRLTQAYSASPLCSPTRSSIMVGQAPARTGITSPVCHLPTVVLEKQLGSGNARVQVANSLTRLKTEYHTLAEALREAGYATAHFGKWHLGHNLAPGDAYEPKDQGFEVDWPHTPKAAGPGGGYFAPWKKFITDPAIEDEPGRHVDHRMADEAGRFIRESKGRPFFVNFWMFSVHSPWNARPAEIEHFRKKADPANPQKNPLYAAMVKGMDDAVGRLLQHLEESGEAENTLIVFWSDNGGYAYPPKQTDPAGYAEIPATSNLPYRSGKASLYEGGTREPGIVVWPGKVKPGTTADFLIQSTDLYPTLLHICGAAPRADQKMDGFDQTAALTGGPPPRTRIFCHFPHGEAARDSVMDGFYAGSSVRDGDLKLIRFYARAGDGSDELELYDLSTDPGERRNLVREQPGVATRLNGLLDEFLKDTGAVIPRLNPNFGKVAPRKKAPAPDDLPGGWKNRAGLAAVRDGALNVQTKGAGSFLGVGAGLSAGVSRLSFRVRAPSAGDGKVTLLGEAGAAEGLSVPYKVAGGSAWETVTVDLPVKEKAGILRLYLPSGSAAVDFDDIVLTPPQGAPRRWTF
ncbi:MAG: sulfatase [Verrucomicrobia bacterium]|nr:sulfatase [Verrucomicrobiota bacterium]